jgi:hypothetical protein
MTSIKRHMNAVADLGCILCRHLNYGKTSAELHHPREAAGGAQKASDWLVIPLCPEHHRGNSGLHGLGTKGFYTRYKMGEWDLLAKTIQALTEERNP